MAKTQIMVVEDEGIVALSIQRILENLGYKEELHTTIEKTLHRPRLDKKIKERQQSESL